MLKHIDRLGVTAAAACIFSLSLGHANEKFLVLGAGSVPCARYLKEESSLFTSWILGYLTRFNQDTRQFNKDQEKPNDVLSSTGINGFEAEVVKYCREHPTDFLVNAVDLEASVTHTANSVK